MKPEQLASLKEEIAHTIKIVVNGKIDLLTKEVANIHARLDQQDESLAPAIETIKALGSGRKFIVWSKPYLIFIASIGALLTWLKT